MLPLARAYLKKIEEQRQLFRKISDTEAFSTLLPRAVVTSRECLKQMVFQQHSILKDFPLMPA